MKKQLDGIIHEYVEVPFPEQSEIDIPLKVFKGPNMGIHMITQFYLLPHIWISFLYMHFLDVFNHRVRGPVDAFSILGWSSFF